jgi:cysteine-S-conjugate beta-lyase
MSKKTPNPNSLKPETRLVVAGREYAEHGIVNPAVYHASTITFPTVKALHERDQPYTYGRRGTPTSRAVETAITALEGGHNCKISSSGLAAVTTTLLAFLKTGEHLLIPDTAYHPVRQLCDSVLKGLGIETTYYDPLIGRGIAGMIRANTKVVYCESPGSQTMEVQDVPAIADVAHSKNCVVILDNTWAGGFYFNAFAHGCDVSVQAATKYIVGHSDAMLGSTVCNEKTWGQFKLTYETMGQFAGPDDMYLALRGLRTMSVRLERHMRNATTVAEWLRGRNEVESVLYPALSNAAGHAVWKRDFTGASGLFSVVLKPVPDQSVAAMLDGLNLFGMGFSWGGFESLAVPFKPVRTATTWTAQGPCLRFHIGLENPEDLIDDLKQGFDRLKKSS